MIIQWSPGKVAVVRGWGAFPGLWYQVGTVTTSISAGLNVYLGVSWDTTVSKTVVWTTTPKVGVTWATSHSKTVSWEDR